MFPTTKLAADMINSNTNMNIQQLSHNTSINKNHNETQNNYSQLNKLQTNITQSTSPNYSVKLTEITVKPTQFLYFPQNQTNNLKKFSQKSSISKIEQKHHLKENKQQVQDPVGGRLQQHIQAWEQIGVQDIILKGISSDWISEESPHWLDSHKYIPPYKQNQVQRSALETLILKELQENIIVEVNGNQLKWLNPIFAIPKKGKAGWRKIINCKRLNSHLWTQFCLYGGIYL
ncbi:MAG: hypothetical protein EZS28_050982 [Streblomastix strix]|uniref:Uncharacterized protein n=1 Tax=Streblomastix strix TaxID=222440 RepID=A0A5J4T700_9EUKA|nr:MAG: hypothetical protein EZS28_050982 [Streblomastix strix]